MRGKPSRIWTRFETISLVKVAGLRPRRDLAAGWRSFPAGKYLIFYRADAGNVTVLRIVHGRRDIGPVLNG